MDTACKTPVRYNIGEIDSRFGTNREEIRRIAQNAELVWENALNTDLFVYDEQADLSINFVYDERQKNAEIEAELREDLEAKEGMSEGVAAQYERLIAEFRTLKKQYEPRVVAYEKKLKAYNNEVTEWNDKGGAPRLEIETLNAEQEALMKEQASLQALSLKLNSLVTELNRIGARGNALIKDYNTIVEEYNERFSESHEFAQGDYAPEAINIYQFDSEDELMLVLAHEFGHALSLGHVENEESIMYRTMGEQSLKTGISQEDKAEFDRLCVNRDGPRSFFRFVGDIL
jgi:DNA repair exonuclease SbcCD ATPase subunit